MPTGTQGTQTQKGKIKKERRRQLPCPHLPASTTDVDGQLQGLPKDGRILRSTRRNILDHRPCGLVTPVFWDFPSRGLPSSQARRAGRPSFCALRAESLEALTGRTSSVEALAPRTGNPLSRERLHHRVYDRIHRHGHVLAHSVRRSLGLVHHLVPERWFRTMLGYSACS